MLVSLTVGKVDAGVAVLLTEDKRLVSAQHRFPTASIHLPIPERIIGRSLQLSLIEMLTTISL